MRIAPARLCLLPVVLLALAEAGSPANSVAGAERPGSLGAYALQNATLIGTARSPTDTRPPAEDFHPSDSAEPARPITDREFHANGKIRIVRELVPNAAGKPVLHGIWQWWDESGRLVVSGEFRQGKREGTWKRLHQREEATAFQEEPYV